MIAVQMLTVQKASIFECFGYVLKYGDPGFNKALELWEKMATFSDYAEGCILRAFRKSNHGTIKIAVLVKASISELETAEIWMFEQKSEFDAQYLEILKKATGILGASSQNRTGWLRIVSVWI